MDMEEDNPFATRGAAHTDVRLLLRKEGERGYTGPLPPATPPVDDDVELTPGTSPSVEDESQDDEIDPHIATTPTAPVSLHQEMTRLVATIIKSFIGSGVLFLPQAFYNGGWLFSSVIMAFMAVLTGITIFRLIECRHVIPGSYSYVGFRAYGRWAKVAVDVCLVLSQAGFCCVYIAFIARNVLQLLNVNKCWVSSDYLWLLVFMQLLVFAPLSWIKRIQSLGWTSLAANTLIVLGLSGILLYSGIEWAHDASPMQVSAMNTADFPLFLGTAVYAFEGIGMIVPMYESLSKEGQRRFPTVMTTTLGGIAAVYIIIGMVPYLYFSGKAHVELQDAITLNLPREWWAYLIIAGYCVALIFSYPLMLFPALRILERVAAPKLALAKGRYSNARRNAFRTFVVACTLGISYGGSSQLNNMVSLVGCFACTPLAFILPCMFHLKLVPNTKWTRYSNFAIILFGVAVFVYSTVQAIRQWSTSDVNACLLTPNNNS